MDVNTSTLVVTQPDDEGRAKVTVVDMQRRNIALVNLDGCKAEVGLGSTDKVATEP